MLEVGSTISMEAWDLKYKNNLDWNHAWGAAPANIIPRFLLGVRPLEPGFGKVLIMPQPGTLERVSGTIPTIRGPITVALKNEQKHPIELRVDIPADVMARVGLPLHDGQSTTLVVDGKTLEAERDGKYLFLDDLGPGTHILICE